MTKTLFICDDKTVVKHIGEEYDDFLELTSNITQSNINQESNRISNVIRRLAVDGSVVKIILDSVPPYHAVVMDLMLVMKPREGITIDYADGRKQIMKMYEDAGNIKVPISDERRKEVQWLLDMDKQ